MGKCCTFDIHKYIHTPVSADKDVKMQKALHIKYTVVWNYTLAAYEKWVWRMNLQFRWDSLGGFPFKMHWYNIFVVFTAHHCHWTSLGNAHSLVGGWSWCLSSFARQGVVSRGLGLTPLSTRRWRLPTTAFWAAPSISRGHLSYRFFARRRPRGVPLTACAAERVGGGGGGWGGDGGRVFQTRDTVGLKHLCAQQRYVSSKHVYSELIYRSVGGNRGLVVGGGWYINRQERKEV